MKLLLFLGLTCILYGSCRKCKDCITETTIRNSSGSVVSITKTEHVECGADLKELDGERVVTTVVQGTSKTTTTSLTECR